MKTLWQLTQQGLKLNAQSGIRLIGMMIVAIGLSACSSTPCQEDDPESSQGVLAKDLAIPPNLLNPAIENKPFNEAVKPSEKKQP